MAFDGAALLTWSGAVFAVGALLLALLLCWGATLVGLPGNWAMVAVGLAYDCCLPEEWRIRLTWWILGGMLFSATIGEVAEFLASALGVHRKGGSRLSAVLSLVGAMVGGVLGAFVGIPIPFIGPVIGILFFSSVGALAGAAAGEDWHGRPWEDSLSVGFAAFWGRLAGSLAKTLTGGLIIGFALAGLVL